MWMKLGSVRTVKPAQRMIVVAVPTKKTDPVVSSAGKLSSAVVLMLPILPSIVAKRYPWDGADAAPPGRHVDRPPFRDARQKAAPANPVPTLAARVRPGCSAAVV